MVEEHEQSMGAAAGAFAIDADGAAGCLTFGDALFRRHRKSGWAYAGGPSVLEGPVADTHAHLHMLSDVPLVLARCAWAGVDFVCSITDPSEGFEGAQGVYRALPAWRREAQERLPLVLVATQRALSQAREAGVEALAGHGGDVQARREALASGLAADEARAARPAESFAIPHVRLATGVHPHNARLWSADVEASLRELLADPRTAALGEIGLDYHYDLSPRDEQREVFRRQIAIAHETGLPIALHIRDAHDDAFAILEEEGWPSAGVLLHCCSVGPEELSRWLSSGSFVAFGGAVTFANSDHLRASAAIVPDGRLLTETDSPYMAPVPFRGLECGPEYTVFTAARLAEVRGCAAGAPRAAMLAAAHDAGWALLDRAPTAWQLACAPAGGRGGAA